MQKLLVIGNCQARPLAGFFERTGRFEILPPIILHLSKPEEKATHVAAMDQADLILCQSTADTFHLAHLRSGGIRETHPNAFVWPNIFYAGQQPFLRYMTVAGGRRLMGPLEALHDLRIYARWRVARGLAPGDTEFAGPVDDLALRVRRQSLAALRARDENCDAQIADFIAAHQDTKRLFFTFNHPTQALLSEVGRQLLVQMGLPPLEDDPAQGGEPLSRYVVPSLWPGEPESAQDCFQGDDYQLEAEGHVSRVPGPPRRYDRAALEAAFFEVYDHDDTYRHPENIRLTPKLDIDPVWQ